MAENRSSYFGQDRTLGDENKENLQLQPPSSLPAKPAAVSSPSEEASVKYEEVKGSMLCGLCQGLLASSLVLSCGHIFCGHCLYEHLNNKPACPTCQVCVCMCVCACMCL